MLMEVDAVDRERFKEQLRAMAAGRGDGIDLDSPERWVIETITDAMSFFRHLDRLIVTGSVLYFEGYNTHSSVVRFYEAHRASNVVSVIRDTIYPIPDTFHVLMTPVVLEGIISILGQHPQEACFRHVKAYRDGQLLFTFHDAFDGSDLWVSDNIPEQSVRTFCSAVGVTFRREPNVHRRNPEQLQRLLWALEKPQRLRVNWPLWKKLLFFWKR